MGVRIRVPDTPFSSQTVTLEGTTYNFTFKFNDSDEAWYLNIDDVDGNSLLSGIKMMPQQAVIKRYDYLNVFQNGTLWVLRVQRDFDDIGRNNFGLGKTYELWYLTDQEEEEFGASATIQL